MSQCPFPGPLIPLKHRTDIGPLLESLQFQSGAELGVLKGEFAARTLKKWPSCKNYTLVDVWKHQDNYVDINNPNDSEHETSYKAAMKRLEPFREKLTVCRNFTSHCAHFVPDESLDYVYIDARHDRKGVAADLWDWWPKLKCGGIFAGHDYVSQSDSPQQGGQDWTINYDGTRDETRMVVKGAVDDFSKLVRRQLFVTYREPAWNTWLLRK